MTLPLSPAGRRYGFLQSPPDHRDYGAFRFLGLNPLPIPASGDLEAFTGPVKDQGAEGSCTAHAGSENLELLFRKYKNQQPIFSPQFLYYKERELDGSIGQGDVGSYGRTAVKVLQQFGCALLSDDPYDTSKMDVPPTPQQLQSALAYKAGAYHSINNVDEGKHCIASGYPFLIGFDVHENFESDISSNGVMPAPAGVVLGGHEVLVIGYDDTKQDPTSTRKGYFKVRNSWGAGWGDHGNFWMAYEDFPVVVNEGWCQHFGSPWK